MHFIRTTVVLLIFYECSPKGTHALGEAYTGEYPRSTGPVNITVRVPFSPVSVTADRYYQYYSDEIIHYCPSLYESAQCDLSKVGPDLYEFHFRASSTINIPFMLLERSRFNKVTAFRTPLQKATRDFALSPYDSAPLVHYPTNKLHYVDVKCAVKVPRVHPDLSIKIYENSVELCSYANASARDHQSAYYHLGREVFILTCRVQKKTSHPTEFRFILCTSQSSSSIHYLSHYIEFHNSK
nr:unnamed protein product [Spirometra erinaceieuropaei]